MKTRKGGGGCWNKKALNYGKQGRQIANENVAGTQSKPPGMAAAKGRWQHWLEFNLAKITCSHN